MPAQVHASTVAYYTVGDTAPNLERQMLDGNGDPIDLTGCTVTITIAHARYDYYYSPSTRIVDRGSCLVDPDQTNNTGWVSWTPPTDILDPAGNYYFNFEITYADSTRQTIPPNTYLLMVIKPRPGGRE